MNDHSFTFLRQVRLREMDMKKNKPKYKLIVDAAVKVIAQNGYHSSQVSKIAKEAGVADGTIYLYFKKDRKSTRLNSSHVAISYAVFCLKKKQYKRQNPLDVSLFIGLNNINKQ